jgi:hypothetical protein
MPVSHSGAGGGGGGEVPLACDRWVLLGGRKVLASRTRMQLESGRERLTTGPELIPNFPRIFPTKKVNEFEERKIVAPWL